jgi:hypothetical protein
MKRISVLLTIYFFAVTVAQLVSGPVAEDVADAAARVWLEQEPVTIVSLLGLPVEEACEALPSLVTNPPPPAGTTINFSARRESSSADPDTRVFAYPMTLGTNQTEVLRVTLERRNGDWEAVQVGYNLASLTGQGRAWLQGETARYLFIAFTLLILYLLVRPSFFRRWLAAGFEVIRQHRRLVVGTLVVYYLLFFSGTLVGTTLPAPCATAVLEVVNTAVTGLGATEAYGSLNIARAAVVTFYQNFVTVTLTVLFTAALLFGFPAYLLAAASFFTQGIPFGLLGGGSILDFLFIGILLALELTSYFLIVAGGGMLLITLIREGLGSFRRAAGKLVLMLPIAMILLLIGAWYEAAVIILPQLLN